MFIIHAAIMFSNGEIVEGSEYHSIGLLARKIGFLGEHINGFVTNTGEFVLPQEAVSIALQSGQIKASVDLLTPEDLWPMAVQ